MKSMKLTILFAVLAFAAVAQPGVQGGWNVNNYQYKINGIQNDRTATSGFNAGFFYRGWLGYFGVVEPSLSFTRKGAMNTNTVYPVDNYKVRLDYIQLSVPFMFRAPVDRNVDFTIGGGPYASVLAHASSKTEYQNGDRIDNNYSIGNGTPDDFTPLDAGLRFQSGLRLGQVNLSAAYDLGLADIAPQNNEEIHTRSFSLNLGFFFW